MTEDCWWDVKNQIKSFQIPKDEAKRAQYYLDLNEKYGEKGYLRFYGGFCQPLMVVTAPETMKRILKTAGNTNFRVD